MVPAAAITNAAGARTGEMPFVTIRQRADQRAITLNWTQPAKGGVQVRIRMGNRN